MDKPELRDITGPKHVSIQVSQDRKRIWVNVDGWCILRCCQIENLAVEDLSTRRTCDKCGQPFEVVVRRRITTCPTCDPNSVLSTNANCETKVSDDHPPGNGGGKLPESQA